MRSPLPLLTGALLASIALAGCGSSSDGAEENKANVVSGDAAKSFPKGPQSANLGGGGGAAKSPTGPSAD